MNKEILIAEISGKRPGDVRARPTEKFATKYDHVIISNNSDGYVTDWDIINVPDDYREWYIQNAKSSENAWYAPMNRSYAIKYAREHGYKYLIQLDDNIVFIEIGFAYKQGGCLKRYRVQSRDGMLDDFVDMLVSVLKNTNAGMAGCQLAGIGSPDEWFLCERYCYSFFALDLATCPAVFQGDFEDDVEYRLKLAQMGLPVVQVSPLRYSKTGQAKNRDLSGCRAEYLKAGLKRGEHMMKLYGDVYKCTMKKRRNSVNIKCADEEAVNFKHYLKPFKVGVIVYDMEPIKQTMARIIKANAKPVEDKAIVKEKRIKNK